ncbi:MAG TPA: deoxyribose-phosphate aldolase [Thermodesulfobacteriota bacterium]
MPDALTRADLARLIDWGAALKPDLTERELAAVCDEAVALGVGQLCAQPSLVEPAVRRLGGRVAVVSVAGFPHGASLPEVKAREAALAVEQGAAEVDMVINRGWLKGGEASRAEADVAAVVRAAAGRPVKVILETAALTEAEARLGCRVAEAAGASFVKTSTGFGYPGATVASVRLLAEAVGGRLGVKASGGIRTLADTRAMLAAGATRIGTSAAKAILDEFES